MIGVNDLPTLAEKILAANFALTSSISAMVLAKDEIERLQYNEAIMLKALTEIAGGPKRHGVYDLGWATASAALKALRN